jgi:hypothetical protein
VSLAQVAVLDPLAAEVDRARLGSEAKKVSVGRASAERGSYVVVCQST